LAQATTGDSSITINKLNSQQYIHNPVGYVGIQLRHGTEYTWPWYGQLVALLSNHPAIVTATIKIADARPSIDRGSFHALDPNR